MKLFGITGGIAMGKSTAGRLLRQQGVAVIDTDDLARQVVEPGQPALAEIRERFGPAVFLPDGRLDRARCSLFLRPAPIWKASCIHASGLYGSPKPTPGAETGAPAAP
jgi:dephospho-CoA kinase